MEATTERDESESARAAMKRTRERTCAGCGKHVPPAELVRVVRDPSSREVAVDLANSAFGRGAHVHAAPSCVVRAVRGGLARVFKAEVVADAGALQQQIVLAAERRIVGLLSGARRAGQLAVGADAVEEAIREETAALVVVARDAAAATKLPGVGRLVAKGAAVPFGDKVRLGEALGNRAGEVREVAVVAVLHRGVADAVIATHRMSGPFMGASRSEEAWSSSSEVR
jgi:predicted RNA-binding protein YlxR (DUF448 family)